MEPASSSVPFLHKISIIDTVWDPNLREGGAVLADETNKAFTRIAGNADWCFYIQGDEVLHEQYHPAIKEKDASLERQPGSRWAAVQIQTFLWFI
jgi:hypothetical protein